MVIYFKKGKGQFKNPEKLAKTIKHAIIKPYRLSNIAQESIDVTLSILTRCEIRALEASIKDLDKTIEQSVVVLLECQI